MKIVVDANIFLSALIKDSTARALLKHPLLEFYTVDHLLGEVEEHLIEISEKSGLSKAELKVLISGLSKEMAIVPTSELKHKIPEAKKLIYDLDDVPYLALALALGKDAVIWSHDKGFKKQNVLKIISTQELLDLLGGK